MSRVAKVPAIRFAGFTSPWRQCKLGDVLEEYLELSEKGKGYEHVSLTKEGVVPKTARYDRDSLVTHDDKQYRITHLNDICYNPANLKFGVICRNTYSVGIFSPIYITFRVEKNNDPAFIERLVRRESFIAHALKSQEGTVYERMAVKPADLIEEDICVPCYKEQRLIGLAFDGIDNLINLHQCKHNRLVVLKKALLEKMFPRDGSSYPELRFTGFTDPWEQRRFSELVTMHARIGWQNLRKSEFLDSGDYYLITGTDFEDGFVNLETCHFVSKDRYDQDPNIQVDNESILITKDGTLGKVALVRGLNKPATLNAGVFHIAIRDSDRVDNGYLYQYLKAPFLLDYVAQTATGGTIKHLNQNILVDFPVRMPSKREQHLIGDLFLRLDNLIILHQRKLELLKNVKKSMLNEMFV